MDAKKADERIVLSRQTLARYDAMVRDGVDPAPGTGTLVAEEIRILEGIAEAHPGKAAKLTTLIADWRAFGDQLRARLH